MLDGVDDKFVHDQCEGHRLGALQGTRQRPWRQLHSHVQAPERPHPLRHLAHQLAQPHLLGLAAPLQAVQHGDALHLPGNLGQRCLQLRVAQGQCLQHARDALQVVLDAVVYLAHQRRAVLQLTLAALGALGAPVTQVGHGEHVVRDPAALAGDGCAREPHGVALARLAPVPLLALLRGPRQGLGRRAAVRQQKGRNPPQHLLRAVAAQVLERAVGAQDAPLGVRNEHALLAFKGDGGDARVGLAALQRRKVAGERPAHQGQDGHVRGIAQTGTVQVLRKKPAPLQRAPAGLQGHQTQQHGRAAQPQAHARPGNEEEHPVGIVQRPQQRAKPVHEGHLPHGQRQCVDQERLCQTWRGLAQAVERGPPGGRNGKRSEHGSNQGNPRLKPLASNMD